jgi:hypothetical protein
LRLHLALVFLTQIHTLDDNPVIVWQDPDHFTALAFIFKAATNNFNSITFTNLYSHGNHSW